MPESTTDRGESNRLFCGGSHPVIAILAFFASFLFAALPFIFDTDNVLFVAPCLIACFSCSILFLRLLLGGLGPMKWIFLGVAAQLCYVAGEQWYLVVFLAGGTFLGSFLIAGLIGDFVPIVRDVKY